MKDSTRSILTGLLIGVALAATPCARADESYECMVGGPDWCNLAGSSRKEQPTITKERATASAHTPGINATELKKIIRTSASAIDMANELAPALGRDLAKATPDILYAFASPKEAAAFAKTMARILAERGKVAEEDKAQPRDVIHLINKSHNSEYEAALVVPFVPYIAELPQKAAIIAYEFCQGTDAAAFTKAVAAHLATVKSFPAGRFVQARDVIRLIGKNHNSDHELAMVRPLIPYIKNLAANAPTIAYSICKPRQAVQFSKAVAQHLETLRPVVDGLKAPVDDVIRLIRKSGNAESEVDMIIPLIPYMSDLPRKTAVIAYQFSVHQDVEIFTRAVADHFEALGQKEALIPSDDILKLINKSNNAEYEANMTIPLIPYIKDLHKCWGDIAQAIRTDGQRQAFLQAYLTHTAKP